MSTAAEIIDQMKARVREVDNEREALIETIDFLSARLRVADPFAILATTSPQPAKRDEKPPPKYPSDLTRPSYKQPSVDDVAALISEGVTEPRAIAARIGDVTYQAVGRRIQDLAKEGMIVRTAEGIRMREHPNWLQYRANEILNNGEDEGGSRAH